jgi:hypothetical protein
MPERYPLSRRDWLRRAAALACGGLIANRAQSLAAPPKGPARIAITLDLEMSRNFPQWEDTHWDYEKGNLDEASKRYSVAAGERVAARGGKIHYFCVGRVLEQADVSWLKRLADQGHPIGNHTYDHVYVLAKTHAEVQFRFQRAPWLIGDRTPDELIEENVRLATLALESRLGIQPRGFRTPGGFATGLHDRDDVQAMLLRQGFPWVSSLYPAHKNTAAGTEPDEAVYADIVAAQSRAQPFRYPSGLIELPMSPISDIGAFRTGRWKLEWFLEAVRRAVTWTIEHGAVFDFLAHPSCLGVVDPEFRTIDLICELVAQSGGRAKLSDLDELAAGVAA